MFKAVEKLSANFSTCIFLWRYNKKKKILWLEVYQKTAMSMVFLMQWTKNNGNIYLAIFSVLTTGLLNKAVALACLQYSWPCMLKVAPCTVVRSYSHTVIQSYIQIFSAWWVTTILYNYGAKLCKLHYNQNVTDAFQGLFFFQSKIMFYLLHGLPSKDCYRDQI